MKSNETVDTAAPKILTPKEFYRGLNEHVIGQHAVKVALSVGVHNHLIRANMLRAKSKSSISHNIQDADGGLAQVLALTPTLHGQVVASQSPILTPKTSTSFPSREGLKKIDSQGDESSFNPESSRDDVVEADGANNRPSSDNSVITLRSGKQVETVTIEKTNILLLGPTGMP